MRQERTQLGLKDKIELLALAESWRIWTEIQSQLFLWAAILEEPRGQDITEQRDGERRPYSWDFYNRLSSVSKNGIQVVSYTYDADNQRVQRVGKDGTTVYAYGRSGALTYQKNITTGKARTYVYLNDQVIGWTDTAADGTQSRYYALTDQLGSVTKVTNAAAEVVWSSEYNPFGKTAGIEGLYDFDGSFGGLQPDPDTGLLLAWNRWLDPETGRFISEDPIRAGANFYAFGNNSPLMYTDRTGLEGDFFADAGKAISDFFSGLFSGGGGSGGGGGGGNEGGSGKSAGPPAPMPKAPDAEMKEFMKGAYRDPNLPFQMPAGYRDMTVKELVDAGLDADALGGGKGFKARVYISDKTGKVVVAFAGTDDPTDLDADIGQALEGDDKQYNQAITIGRTLADSAYGKNLSFTGHSLGGGLASAAALAGNKDAVTYNAAGLSDNYKSKAAAARDGAYTGNIRAYVSASDPLTKAQSVLPLPQGVGTRIVVPEYSFGQAWNKTYVNNDPNESVARHAFRAYGAYQMENHMFAPLDSYFGGQ